MTEPLFKSPAPSAPRPPRPRKARVRRPKRPPAVAPHRCVILAFDPGARTGWAILGLGRRIDSGVIRIERRDRLRTIAREARTLALAQEIPLVVAMETWSPGGWRTHETIVAMGRSVGVIETALSAELVLPSQIVRVLTQTWRAGVIGGRHGTDAWKHLARLHARERCGVEAQSDEAEAILVGLWASRAAEVGDIVERRTP